MASRIRDWNGDHLAVGDALSGESCSWQKPETDEQTLWMTWRTQDGHSRLRSNGSGTKEKRSPTAYTTFHTKSDRSSVATHQKHRQKRSFSPSSP